MKVRIQFYKQKKYADGTSPVVASVNIDRKPKRKVLFSIHEKYWDFKNGVVKKSNILHPEYNRLITEKQYEYDKKIINAQIKGIKITEAYIFENKDDTATLLKAIEKYQEILSSKKKNLEAFKAIHKDVLIFGDISITSLDNDWAVRFYNYLKDNNNSKNTAGKKILRLNTVLKSYGTHFNIDTPKEKTTKNKLSANELMKIRDIPLLGYSELIRDTFMLCFFLRGRRIGDVLTLEPKHIVNNRLVKVANKTEKEMNIKIIQQAKTLIEKYVGQSDYYVLPFLKLAPLDELLKNAKTIGEQNLIIRKYKKHIESKTAVINRYLKIIADMAQVEKNISTHVARHTFAYLGDQYGLSGKRIQDMLEHSDLRTTENYIHDLNNADMLDNAMDDFMSKLLFD